MNFKPLKILMLAWIVALSGTVPGTANAGCAPDDFKCQECQKYPNKAGCNPNPPGDGNPCNESGAIGHYPGCFAAGLFPPSLFGKPGLFGNTGDPKQLVVRDRKEKDAEAAAFAAAMAYCEQKFPPKKWTQPSAFLDCLATKGF